METYSMNSPLVSDLMILSHSGSYSAPIILVLSLAIIIMAIRRKAHMIAAIFTLFFICIITILLVSYFFSPYTSDNFRFYFMLIRHAGQWLRILPYALILWMLIMAGKKEPPIKQTKDE